jgi:hypothetical protein
MKRTLSIAVFLTLISIPGRASATQITYANSLTYGLTFNLPWATAEMAFLRQSEDGAGFYSASASFLSSADDNYSWMQSSLATGSAGGPLGEFGISEAINTVVFLLMFDLGAEPVDLVITCTEFSVLKNSNFVGETSFSGGAQLLFDSNLFTPQLQTGQVATFSNLTGQHTFRITTTVGGGSDSTVPDSGSTLLLFGMGLAGMAAVRRRFR